MQSDCDIILDSITEGVFTVDREWRITSFNRAAEKITGIPRSRAIGQPCKDILRADICEGRCTLAETIRTGEPIICKRVTLIDVNGQQKPINITTALLKDGEGNIIGGVETFRDLSRIEQLRKEILQKYKVADIISRSHRMREIFTILPGIAQSSSTVLIEGESGTGKELVARALHSMSLRKNRPFIAVNCGALPDTLLESELFGYKAGAFTDAKTDKPGRFALAEGGTLLLDEIGDVSPAMQVRLLRFLQEKVYDPLGSVQPVRGNVRVVAATNKDLAQLVRDGSFREDLYYRINIVKLEVPPLRDRMEDIPLLVDHFIERFNSLQGKNIAGITENALACLMAYRFPGNVRELENIIERAFVLCHTGLIELALLPPGIYQAPVTGEPPTDQFSFRQMEATFLMNALRRNNWNRKKTAEDLDIHKTTLFRKIKALGLKLPLR
ncbi:MAG: sigma 54-interacting transcriptional regulator [Candidatus Krumholzibacteria bacterium]|nr:sigma 54-interacting transcriptional regulator [Candidatus Krumholzibacteria bacterium]